MSKKSRRRRKGRKRKRKYVRFTEKDDKILLRESEKYEKIPWTKISREIFKEKYNPGQLFQRYHRVLMPSRASWTEDEDDKLWDLVEELGTRWSEIARQLGTKRCDVWCRQRYNTLKARKLKEDRIRRKRKRQQKDNLEARTRKRKQRKTNEKKKVIVQTRNLKINNEVKELRRTITRSPVVGEMVKYEVQFEKQVNVIQVPHRPREESSPHRICVTDRVPPPPISTSHELQYTSTSTSKNNSTMNINNNNQNISTTTTTTTNIPRPPMIQVEQVNNIFESLPNQYQLPSSNSMRSGLMGGGGGDDGSGGVTGFEVYDGGELVKTPQPHEGVIFFNSGLTSFPIDEYNHYQHQQQCRPISMECHSPHSATQPDLFEYWNNDILMI